VLECTGVEPDELDHYEISEAFASIPLAWQREFDADMNRLNPRGGSIGLGRPGPAAGLRSLATTLSALEATGGKLGIQVSEGLGSAGDALLIELLPP
jgi:acetyl-CoA acyltransferase